MRFLTLLFGFFLLAQSACFAVNLEAFPKGGIYDNPRFIKLQSDHPEDKIIWTLNPEGSLDEAFVYESPIPIHFSQELWFFTITGENQSSPFQKEKYTIRTDPRRYSRDVFIASFSPFYDKIEIRNDGDQRISLKDWCIEGQNTLFTFNSQQFLEAHSSIQIPFALGDALDSVILRSPDRFPKDLFRYKLRATNTQTQFTRAKDENFIMQ